MYIEKLFYNPSGYGFHLKQYGVNLQCSSSSNLGASAVPSLSLRRGFSTRLCTRRRHQTERRKCSRWVTKAPPLFYSLSPCMCPPVHGWMPPANAHAHTRVSHQTGGWGEWGSIKILQLLSHWLWSSLSGFPLVFLCSCSQYERRAVVSQREQAWKRERHLLKKQTARNGRFDWNDPESMCCCCLFIYCCPTSGSYAQNFWHPVSNQTWSCAGMACMCEFALVRQGVLGEWHQ